MPTAPSRPRPENEDDDLTDLPPALDTVDADAPIVPTPVVSTPLVSPGERRATVRKAVDDMAARKFNEQRPFAPSGEQPQTSERVYEDAERSYDENEHYQRQVAHQQAMQARQQEIAARRQQISQQKAVNADREAKMRGAGQKFYTDAYGNLQPVLEAGTKRALYDTTPWEDGGTHPKTGEPTLVKRDQYGQRQFRTPQVVQGGDVHDTQLYYKFADDDLRPAGDMTALKAHKNPTIANLARRSDAARRAAIWKEAIRPMEAAKEAVDVEVATAKQRDIELQERIDQLTAASAASGGAAANPELQNLVLEQADLQEKLKPMGALGRMQRNAQLDLAIFKTKAAHESYSDLLEERRAILRQQGKPEEGDPIIQSILTAQKTYGVAMERAVKVAEREAQVAQQVAPTTSPNGGAIKQSAKAFATGATAEGIYAASEGLSRLYASSPVRRGIEAVQDKLTETIQGFPLTQEQRASRIADRRAAMEKSGEAAFDSTVVGYADQTKRLREQIRRALPVDREFAESKLGQIAQGGGQAVGTLATAALGGGGLAAASVGQMYQEAYDDAKQPTKTNPQGATDAQAHSAAMKYLPAAGLDFLSNRLIIGKLLKPLVGKTTVGQIVTDVLKTAATEGATEGAQQAYLNVIAKKLEGYDPNRALDQEVYDSILVGAVIGGGITTAGSAAKAAFGTREPESAQGAPPTDTPPPGPASGAPLVPTPPTPESLARGKEFTDREKADRLAELAERTAGMTPEQAEVEFAKLAAELAAPPAPLQSRGPQGAPVPQPPSSIKSAQESPEPTTPDPVAPAPDTAAPAIEPGQPTTDVAPAPDVVSPTTKPDETVEFGGAIYTKRYGDWYAPDGTEAKMQQILTRRHARIGNAQNQAMPESAPSTEAAPAPVAPEPTAPTSEQPAGDPLAQAVSAYEDGDDTAGDLVNRVDELISSGAAPQSLRVAVDKYRAAAKEDFEEFAGRGDMDSAEDEFVAAVRGVSGPATPTQATPTAPQQPSGSSQIATDDIASATNIEDVSRIGGERMMKAKGNDELAAIQRAMKERVAALEKQPALEVEFEEGAATDAAKDIPKRVRVAGAEYDVVRQNPDGTLTLRSDGGEFDTTPGEKVDTVAERPKETPQRIDFTRTSREQHIASELDAKMRVRKIALLEAENAIRRGWSPPKPLPVGVNKISAFLGRGRYSPAERKLRVAYDIAKRNAEADTRTDAETAGKVYDRLKAESSESPARSTAPTISAPPRYLGSDERAKVGDYVMGVFYNGNSNEQVIGPVLRSGKGSVIVEAPDGRRVKVTGSIGVFEGDAAQQAKAWHDFGKANPDAVRAQPPAYKPAGESETAPVPPSADESTLTVSNAAERKLKPNHIYVWGNDWSGRSAEPTVQAFPYDGDPLTAAKAAKMDGMSAHVLMATDADGKPSKVMSPNFNHVADFGTPEAQYIAGDLDAPDRALAEKIKTSDYATAEKLASERAAKAEAKAADYQDYIEREMADNAKDLAALKAGKTVTDLDSRFTDKKDYFEQRRRRIQSFKVSIAELTQEAATWRRMVPKKAEGATATETDRPAPAAPESTADSVEGEKINREWTAFAPDSGTLNIPRAEMPQVRSEHRGALVNFLQARGITAKAAMVNPTKLKPTQAEFSPAKVQKARDHTGSERPILVSSDNHVVDGHHQWVAGLDDETTPMPVIRLNAPIREVLAQMKEFPSAEQAKGAGNSAAGDGPMISAMAAQQTKSANVGRIVKMMGDKLYSSDISKTSGKELVQNAVDAVMQMPAGSRTIYKGTDDDHFYLGDSGPGMSPETIINKFLPAGESGKSVGSGGGLGLAKIAILGGNKNWTVATIHKTEDGRYVRSTLKGTGASYYDYIDNPPKVDLRPNTDIELADGMTLRYEYLDTPPVETGTMVSVETPNAYRAEYFVDDAMKYQPDITTTGIYKPGFGKPDGNSVAGMLGLKTFKPSGSEQKELGLVHSIDTPDATYDFIAPKNAKMKKGRYRSFDVLNRGILQFNESINFPEEVALPEGLAINIKPKVRADHANYPFTTNREGLIEAAKQPVSEYFGSIGTTALREINDRYKGAVDQAPKLPGRDAVVLDVAQQVEPALMSEVVGNPHVGEVNDEIADIQNAILRVLKAKYGNQDGGEGFGRARYGGLITGGGAYGVHFGKPKSTEPSVIYHDPFLTYRDARKDAATYLTSLARKRDIEAGVESADMPVLDDDELSQVSYEFFRAKLTGIALHEAMHQVTASEGEELARHLTFKAGDIISAVLAIVEKPRKPSDYAALDKSLTELGEKLAASRSDEKAGDFIVSQGGYHGYALKDYGAVRGGTGEVASESAASQPTSLTSSADGPRQSAARAISALESAIKRNKDERGKMVGSELGLAYNHAERAALELALLGVRAGRKAVEVVRMAVQRFKALHPKATAEELARVEAAVNQAIIQPPPTPADPAKKKSLLPESLKDAGAPVESIEYEVRQQEARKREASDIVKREGREKAEELMAKSDLPGDTRVAIGGQLINDRMLALTTATPAGAEEIARDLRRITAKMQPELATEAGQQVAMFGGIYRDVRVAAAADYIRSATKKRVAEMGGADAEKAAQEAADVFNKTKDPAARDKAIEKLKEKYTTKPVRKTLDQLKRIEVTKKLNDLGVLTRDDMLEVAGNALGLPGISAQKLKHLADLANRINSAKNHAERSRAELELSEALTVYKGHEAMDVLSSVLTANILSGYTTQVANIEGNALNLISQLGTTALTNPTRLGALTRGLLDGLPLARDQAKSIWATGRGTRDFQDKTAGAGTVLGTVNVSRDFPKVPKPIGDVATKGARALDRIFRFMKAADAVFYYPAREAYARLVATKLIEGEYQGAELDRKVSELLHTTPAAFDSARKQAAAEGYEGVDLGRRVADIIEERRATDHRGTQAVKESERFAAEATFTNEPEGLAGVAYHALKYAVQEGRLAKIPIFKPWALFLKTPANVFNSTLNWTPLGAVRAQFGMRGAGLHNPEKRHFTREERHRLYVQSVIGTAIMGAMLAKILDDENLDISARGPTDAGKRKQLTNAGWSPHSMRIGNRWQSYKDSPLLLPLSIIGHVADSIRYNKPEKDVTLTRRVADAIATSPRTIFETSMLTGLADLMAAASGKGGSGVGRTLSSLPANLGVPYNRLLQQIDQTFDSQQYDSPPVVGGVPFARRAGEPLTDVQGRQQQYSPMQRFGSTESADVVDSLIRDRQVFIPEPGDDVKIGDTVMTDQQRDAYRRISGQRIRIRLVAIAPRLRILTREKAQDEINQITREERAKVKPLIRAGVGVKR